MEAPPGRPQARRQGDDHWRERPFRRKRAQQISAPAKSGTGAGLRIELHRGRAADRSARWQAQCDPERRLDRDLPQHAHYPRQEKEAGPALFSVGGETLSDDLRERVGRAFPSLKYGIADYYGCTECLALSFECSHGRKHVNEDWVILEAVDEAMRPVPDGILSATVLLTVLANEVQPFIRYDLGDCVRFYEDSCPCGSPFRSFQVEGRQATLVRVGQVTLSPLVFDLEHAHAQRVQLVQAGERDFEVRIELADEAVAGLVFEEVIQSVKRVFRDNGLSDVTVRASQAPPELTASGKFHEVLPLRDSNSRS